MNASAQTKKPISAAGFQKKFNMMMGDLDLSTEKTVEVVNDLVDVFLTQSSSWEVKPSLKKSLWEALLYKCLAADLDQHITPLINHAVVSKIDKHAHQKYDQLLSEAIRHFSPKCFNLCISQLKPSASLDRMIFKQVVGHLGFAPDGRSDLFVNHMIKYFSERKTKYWCNVWFNDMSDLIYAGTGTSAKRNAEDWGSVLNFLSFAKNHSKSTHVQSLINRLWIHLATHRDDHDFAPGDKLRLTSLVALVKPDQTLSMLLPKIKSEAGISSKKMGRDLKKYDLFLLENLFEMASGQERQAMLSMVESLPGINKSPLIFSLIQQKLLHESAAGVSIKRTPKKPSKM